jgi:hypothetical protein
LVALESATQSVTGMGGVGVVELKQPARDCGYDRLSRAVTAMAEAGVPEEA